MKEIDFTSEKVQAEVVAWIESLKDRLGSREKWLTACEAADREITVKPVNLAAVLYVFNGYIEKLPPGHDFGHLVRDAINAEIIKKNTKAAFESDRASGLLAGAFHDIGNSVVARYQDRRFGAGHGEVGAYLFYHLTSGLALGENLRLMASYSIAAHTHYVKDMPVEIPAGYVRSPYWADLWELNGNLCGVGPRIARIADRIDTNGITLLVRHILSRCDKHQEGGADLSGSEWVALNSESLSQVFNPQIRDPFGKPPTSLEHVLNYKNSNFGNTIYSQDDYQFSIFEEILNFKLAQFNRVVKVLDPSFHERRVLTESRVEQVLKRISMSSDVLFQQAMEVFHGEMSKLSLDDQLLWGQLFYEIDQQYDQLIHFYEMKMENSENFWLINALVS